MNTACPTDDRLKSLISEAFNELPGAESARLEKIGYSISKKAQCHRSQRSKIQHWIFWLLFGASMTAAAWWTGIAFFQPGPPATTTVIENNPQPVTTLPKQTQNKPVPMQKAQQNKHQPDADTDSSVIYKRELY